MILKMSCSDFTVFFISIDHYSGRAEDTLNEV